MVDFDEKVTPYGPGMAYVALSRCRKIDDLFVSDGAPWNQIRPNWEAEEAFKLCKERSRASLRIFCGKVLERLDSIIPGCRKDDIERLLLERI